MNNQIVLESQLLTQLTKRSCRLCLAPETESFATSKEISASTKKTVYKFTSILISNSDFSITICKSCVRSLTAFVKFRSRCIEINDFAESNGYCQYKSSEVQQNFSEILFDDLGPEVDLLVQEVEKGGLENEEIANEEVVETIVRPEKESESKTRYKLKMKTRSEFQKNDMDEEPMVKLKKKDLTGTLAYQGLCHFCGREFQHLWVHVQTHNENPTILNCEICERGFTSKANLQMHELQHKDPNLPCKTCGKKYRTKTGLNRHQRVHFGKKSFQCTVCFKFFYTSHNLDIHSRVHTGLKPYFCKICCQNFGHTQSLKKHMDKFHNSKDSVQTGTKPKSVSI